MSEPTPFGEHVFGETSAAESLLTWCSRLGSPHGRLTALAQLYLLLVSVLGLWAWAALWTSKVMPQIFQLLCLTNSLLCSIISHPHPHSMTENTCVISPLRQLSTVSACVLSIGCSCNKCQVPWRADVSYGPFWRTCCMQIDMSSGKARASVIYSRASASGIWI